MKKKKIIKQLSAEIEELKKQNAELRIKYQKLNACIEINIIKELTLRGLYSEANLIEGVIDSAKKRAASLGN